MIKPCDHIRQGPFVIKREPRGVPYKYFWYLMLPPTVLDLTKLL